MADQIVEVIPDILRKAGEITGEDLSKKNIKDLPTLHAELDRMLVESESKGMKKENVDALRALVLDTHKKMTEKAKENITPKNSPASTPAPSEKPSESAEQPKERPAISFEDFSGMINPKKEKMGVWDTAKMYGAYTVYRISKYISSKEKGGGFLEWVSTKLGLGKTMKNIGTNIDDGQKGIIVWICEKLGLDKQAALYATTVESGFDATKMLTKTPKDAPAVTKGESPKVPAHTPTPVPAEKKDTPSMNVDIQKPAGTIDITKDAVSIGGMKLKMAEKNSTHLFEVDGTKYIVSTKLKNPISENLPPIEGFLTRSTFDAAGITSAVINDGTLTLAKNDATFTLDWDTVSNLMKTVRSNKDGGKPFNVALTYSAQSMKNGKQVTEKHERMATINAVR